MAGELLTESRLFAAYQVLFAASGQVSSSLLQSVQLPDIKQAYRRRALDTHPDRFAWGDENCRKQCTERFIVVTQAYETLNNYLVLRDKGLVFERKVRGSPPRSGKPTLRLSQPPNPLGALELQESRFFLRLLGKRGAGQKAAFRRILVL